MASEKTSKSLEWSWEKYDTLIESIRESEFPNLNGVTYLDHTGATLYSQTQLKNVFGDLSARLHGNPHSANVSSQTSTQAVEQARDLVLQHFCTSADEYNVVFTSGTTGALKLLADTFPWVPPAGVGKGQRESAGKVYDLTAAAVSKGSLQDDSLYSGNLFCYLQDNHTSVVGMREVAVAKGASAVCVSPAFISSQLTPKVDSTKTNIMHIYRQAAMHPKTAAAFPLF